MYTNTFPVVVPAVAETFEQRFEGLTREAAESVANCPGLREFLPRARAYLVTFSNNVAHDVAHDIAQFLMGLEDTLPKDLAPPVPAIPVEVKDVLEHLLHTDRPRRTWIRTIPEKTIDLLSALAGRMRDAEWGVPEPFSIDPRARFELPDESDDEPLTFEARVKALTIEDALSVVTCAGLQAFLPRALTYLAKWGNGGRSDDVAQWLTGQRPEGPKDLAAPTPEIPVNVKDILARLLCVAPPIGPQPRHPPEKTIVQLRALAAHVRGPSRRPTLDKEVPVAGGPEASCDISAFQRRLQDLPTEQWELIVACEGLWDLLPRAQTFLSTPQHRHHSEAVAHYLMGKVNTLPDGLEAPKPEFSNDVKKLLKQLLRTHDFWKTEPVEKTYKKLDALALLGSIDQLRVSRASGRA
ncbi:hypothetical protein [Pandoraea sputorum]|nr:hypothetical protein [Pandoraea sputorum]